MTSSYFKSLSSDFSGSLHRQQFIDALNANENITPECVTVFNIGDSVEVVFESTLSVGEETELDATINNHAPTQEFQYTGFTNLYIKNDNTKKDKYTFACKFVYPGSSNAGNISKIIATANKDSGADSYEILVMDKTNGQVIAEMSYTNNEEQDVDLGTLTNIPMNQSQIDIDIKRTGGSKKNKAYISSITLFYE